jgi:hypothetical protein
MSTASLSPWTTILEDSGLIRRRGRIRGRSGERGTWFCKEKAKESFVFEGVNRAREVKWKESSLLYVMERKDSSTSRCILL